jgi:hypothetical protein
MRKRRKPRIPPRGPGVPGLPAAREVWQAMIEENILGDTPSAFSGFRKTWRETGTSTFTRKGKKAAKKEEEKES